MNNRRATQSFFFGTTFWPEECISTLGVQAYYKQIIIELTALAALGGREVGQLLNYMKRHQA